VPRRWDADYMPVPSAQQLVPLRDLSPAKAAPLSDAASTPSRRSRCRRSWTDGELMEVIAMARAGSIYAETTECPLAEAVDVDSRLKAGQIAGRAVLIPG
jgi:hypothetical protein